LTFFQKKTTTQEPAQIEEVSQIELERLKYIERVKNEAYKIIFDTANFFVRRDYLNNKDHSQFELIPRQLGMLESHFETLIKHNVSLVSFVEKASSDVVENLKIKGQISVRETGGAQNRGFLVYITWIR
jgi:hypothetical protein